MRDIPASVDEYIARFPTDLARKLRQLRKAIMAAAPDAEEVISYAMPAYRQKGVLVYFAGHSRHIGLYPGAEAIEEFKDDLAGFKTSKGTIQLPIDEPLPLDLISKVVRSRVAANLAKKGRK